MKLVFTYHLDMAGGFVFDSGACPDWSRPMEQCECAEMSFAEVARRMREEGLSLEEVTERTGCGRICTACLPDLRRHLGRG